MPRWFWTVISGLVLCLGLLGCGEGSHQSGPASSPTAAPSPGQQPDAELMASLRAELERVLAQRGVALDADGRPLGKAVTTVPKRDYRTPQRFNNPITGESDLDWNHFQRGDYDQNGEVNVADLTPVGFHYLANSADPDWPAASVADGDGNGEINVADITPIGQNYGAQVAGYVIEAQEADLGWREYGFVPFDQGFFNGTFMEFGYGAPSGTIESDFRVSPAGQVRDLAWDTYLLTDETYDYTTPVLKVIDGKPILAFTAYNDPYTSRLGLAMAQTAHPTAPDDWDVDYDLLVNYFSHDRPALNVIQGEAAIAYMEDNGTNIDIDYMVRSAIAGVWMSHKVGAIPAYLGGIQLINRLGQPAILYNNGGLNVLGSKVPLPTSASDWDNIPANPTLTSFADVEALASGPWVFACGVSGAFGENLAFSRTKTAIPSGPADFTEYLLFGGGSSGSFTSLALVGGIPCVVNMDSTNAALEFFNASSRTDDSAATWFLHTVAGGDSNQSQTRDPVLSLVEGRPAIAAGIDPLTFYWSTSELPEFDTDWRSQTIATGVSPEGTSMVVIDGLPIVAYGLFDDASSNGKIAIAVAHEP